MAQAKPKTGKAGRPLDPNARKIRVLVQFNPAEKADLERLIAIRNTDLAPENVTVNALDVLRGLLAREIRQRDATATA